MRQKLIDIAVAKTKELYESLSDKNVMTPEEALEFYEQLDADISGAIEGLRHDLGQED